MAGGRVCSPQTSLVEGNQELPAGRKSGVTCFISGAMSELSCRASFATEGNTSAGKIPGTGGSRDCEGGTAALPWDKPNEHPHFRGVPLGDR